MTHPIDQARYARRARRRAPMGSQYHALADVAREIGISPATARQRAARGTIPGVIKVGPVWAVPNETRDALVDAGRGRSIAGSPRRRKKVLDTTPA